MCGIVGMYGRRESGDEELVRDMTRLLTHRGPLDEGFLFDSNIALGVRRLSIIDVEGGHQPLFNESGQIGAILNGEIYNYVELRRKLVDLGHRFSTQSDTEVLVHLYEEMGDRMLGELNGMFAMALWDARAGRLLVARDRLGVKPLYYYEEGRRIVFASELKALLLCPFIPRDLDMQALTEYLTLMYIRAPRTPFARVRKLLPGHVLSVDHTGSNVARYWSLSEHCRSDSVDERTAVEMVRSLLADSVRLRLRSDVPVGVFLSGGIDSSTVAALAARQSRGLLNTYAVGFDGEGFDELGYARIVADAFGTNHHETIVKVDDAIRHLPQLVWHLDEPNGDSAIVPTYLVSRFAAESLRVALSGLGGDELFGGYPRYFDGYPLEHAYRRLPNRVRHNVAALAWAMPSIVRDRLQWNALSFQDRYLAEITYMTPAEKETLLARPVPDGVNLDDAFSAYPLTDVINRRMFVDAHTYLPDEILMITDRMSMAVSLEVREPLLDYRLMELAARLPGSLKVDPKRREWKILLKKAMADILPEPILQRRKWGFGAPVSAWMRNGLGGTVASLFRSSEAVRLGIFHGSMVADRIASWSAAPQRRRAAHKLWMLLILEIWTRVFLGRQAAGRPTFDLNDLLADP